MSSKGRKRRLLVDEDLLQLSRLLGTPALAGVSRGVAKRARVSARKTTRKRIKRVSKFDPVSIKFRKPKTKTRAVIVRRRNGNGNGNGNGRRPVNVMAVRRKRRRTVNGGPSRISSRDNFPNFMSGRLQLSAANTFTTLKVNTPIPRLRTMGGKTKVMELLWLHLAVQTIDVIATDDTYEFDISLGTVPTAQRTWNDTRTVLNVRAENAFVTSGMQVHRFPIRVDLQSADGFGYLLAADAFNVSGTSVGQAGAVIFDWRLYYRFVDIPITEFVGIIQSTQST